MDQSGFLKVLTTYQHDMDSKLRNDLPNIIGRTAKSFFDKKSHVSAFYNGGPTPWAVARRQQHEGAGGVSSQYEPPLSESPHLSPFNQYVPTDFAVTISNSVLSEAVHNNGGSVSRSVNPVMHAHFRKEYYIKRGEQGGTVARPLTAKWGALALTKKGTANITTHQHQLMGPSHELIQNIYQKINNCLSSIGHK